MVNNSPDSQALVPLLQQLALKVMMLEEDDVQGLGAFLSQLEELQAQVSQVQDLVPVFQHLTEVGQRLVLQEINVADRALELLGQGVALLQKWDPDAKWPPAGEAWGNYCRLAQELGLGEIAASSPPPAETPAAPVWDDPELVANFLSEAQEHLEGIETRLVYLEQHADDLEKALSEGRGLTTFDLDAIKAKIARVDATSSAAAPRLGEILVEEDKLSPEELSEVLEHQKTMEKPQLLGEMLVQEGKVTPQTVAQALVTQLAEGKPAAEMPVTETVKVDLAKVDNLVDLMGELVIVQSQVRQNQKIEARADQKLERDLGQMTRITSELQKITMSLRMVPIGATFRRMVRLVRDLSYKMGKEVSLHLAGEDTEIDRNMVEAIYDPLVHLMRNAVDHGLETSEERQAQGKPTTGHLWLRAFHQGGDIVIEIKDDGRGLNREAILAKATERGLVPPGQTLAPEKIDHLIFEPGFSTAQAVTEISGRGVGLDVVKQTISQLRGKIDIFSTTGEGSCFVLRLPLTLAIIDGMVVRVGSERYILPTGGVRETLRPAPGDCFTVKAKGELIRVRSQLIPLLRLHRLLELVAGEVHPADALVMVVEHEGEKRALLVDDILGKQEIVIKSLGPLFQKLDGLAGGTILGDGRVGLILDLAGLFKLAEGNTA